jgi:hypothetical protein
MANEEQLSILKQGVKVWNDWREKNPGIRIDLSAANLSGALLQEVDLRATDLSSAVLTDANLHRADLSASTLNAAKLNGANLSKAFLHQANLFAADLRSANLEHAHLFQGNLRSADFRGADLTGADLRSADFKSANLSGVHMMNTNLDGASLVGTNVDKAKVSQSSVYAVNVWDLEGDFEEQKDLIITPGWSPTITVDNIRVAQFIYLILHNEAIRDVINTLTSKSVLILGRFSIPERKAILDALKNKLREYNLLPIVFDFDRPTDKDFTETIKTLAGLSFFVIADISNPKSSPLELQATVPDYQIPFVPIIQEGEQPFSMLADLHKKYNWVLETRSYDSIETLMKALKPGIIDPAIKMHYELRLIKAKEQSIHPLQDFIDK